MNDDLKKTLLQRKFASPEYVEQMRGHLAEAIEALQQALDWVERQQPASSWEQWDNAHLPSTWRRRVLPNLQALESSIRLGLRQYRAGAPDRLRGTSNNVMTLGKDLSNFGEKWWAYVPPEYQQRFDENLSQAIRRASRITWTLAGAWKDAELLNERITGPVDEQDLLRYLKPGEQP